MLSSFLNTLGGDSAPKANCISLICYDVKVGGLPPFSMLISLEKEDEEHLLLGFEALTSVLQIAILISESKDEEFFLSLCNRLLSATSPVYLISRP